MISYKAVTLEPFFILAITLCVSSSASLCHAADYYLSPDGRDSASGVSVDEAWYDSGRATSRMRPGDVLNVISGEYQNIVIIRSGTESSPLIIRGRDTGAGFPVIRDGINVGKQSHVIVEDFEVVRGKGSGVSIRGGDHNIVRRFTVQGHWRGVNIDDGDHNLIEDCRISGGREGIYIYNGASYNKVVRCHVSDNGNPPEYTEGDRHGIAIGGSGVSIGNMVESSEVTGSGGFGHTPALIAMYAPDTLFRNNYIHHNYGDGIMVSIGSEGSIVQGNRIEANGHEAVEAGERGVRALSLVGVSDVEVSGNSLVNNRVSAGSRWHPDDRSPVGVIDVRQGGLHRFDLRSNRVTDNVFWKNSGGRDVLVTP